MNIFEDFKNKWISEDLVVHPAQDETAIISCFKAFGVEPQDDLIALYKTLNGKDEMDSELFRLWPLEEIIARNQSDDELENTLKHGVLFGDLCINCWEFRVNKKGEIVIDHGNAAENNPEKKQIQS